jgi:competence protein CoiA
MASESKRSQSKGGSAQGSGAEVTAKCGRAVVWHWAHLSSTHCDHWWEPETVWHRTWKDRFEKSWQEVPLRDPLTGELHVADVRTPAGLVIEFQHSTIKPEEVSAREAFYQSMIWVVDGCKNFSDPFNFSNMRSRLTPGNGIADFRWFGGGSLFKRWHTTKPVFIDFGEQHGFWRILRFDPATKSGRAGVVDIASFVALASSGTTDFSAAGGPASPWSFADNTHMQIPR